MIISASRRTDIPALYAPWFMHRLRAGHALIHNPRNAHRLGRVTLHPDMVDCIVFWTKNPLPMLEMLPAITRMGYMYYFLFTLTPYDRTLERALPQKETLLDAFCALSDALGPERVDWRYDPVLLSPGTPIDYHLEAFERLCRRLHRHTRRCIISFLDRYARTDAALQMPPDAVQAIAKGFGAIAREYALALHTCAEAFDLARYGIEPAACIDRAKIETLLGTTITAKKDSGQRPDCTCIASVDIGAYDTCTNGCTYCYATTGKALAARRKAAHDPHSPLITGFADGSEIITDRTTPSQQTRQGSLLRLDHCTY